MPHDLNDASPTSLSHIVGQKTVIDQLIVALSACWEDHRRLDDALLVGPPGLGKSQVAFVIGHELATTVHEALGQSIKSISDLNALLLAAGDKEVVFLDEVHELSKTFQTTLYLALDKRKILVRSGSSFTSIPLADFTLLLGSTDEYALLQPLRDRMRLVLQFQFYTPEELTKIIAQRTRHSNGTSMSRCRHLSPSVGAALPVWHFAYSRRATGFAAPRGKTKSPATIYDRRASWSIWTTWVWDRWSSVT